MIEQNKTQLRWFSQSARFYQVWEPLEFCDPSRSNTLRLYENGSFHSPKGSQLRACERDFTPISDNRNVHAPPQDLTLEDVASKGTGLCVLWCFCLQEDGPPLPVWVWAGPFSTTKPSQVSRCQMALRVLQRPLRWCDQVLCWHF